MLSMLMCANCLGVTALPDGEEKVLCRLCGREQSVTKGECFGNCENQKPIMEDGDDERRD